MGQDELKLSKSHWRAMLNKYEQYQKDLAYWEQKYLSDKAELEKDPNNFQLKQQVKHDQQCMTDTKINISHSFTPDQIAQLNKIEEILYPPKIFINVEHSKSLLGDPNTDD